MSEKDKFGFEVNSSGCEVVDVMHMPDTNPVRPIKDVLIKLSREAQKFEHNGQRMPITVYDSQVVVSCCLWLPCGHMVQIGMHLTWDALERITDEEIEQGVRKLVKAAGIEGSKHTDKHTQKG